MGTLHSLFLGENSHERSPSTSFRSFISIRILENYPRIPKYKTMCDLIKQSQQQEHEIKVVVACEGHVRQMLWINTKNDF
jgi:hypothetical protein